MSFGKPQIWSKIKINKINVGFSDNSFDKSLVLILKYIVYEFYGRTTLFEEMIILKILFWKSTF